MEIASRGLIPHVDTDSISKWSKFSKEEVEKLREICFMLTWDNIIYDMVLEKREEYLDGDNVEEMLLKEISQISIDDMSDVKIYARKLYALHKAIREEVH